MPYKYYKIINELRSGGTSHVYKVQDIETEEYRVMKVTSFKYIQHSIWANEIKMLQKFQYIRGVVKMYEFGEVEDPSQEKFGYTVLEMCDDDVFNDRILPDEVRAVFLFLYKILTTIHTLGYCYCDLKPENILRKGKGFRLCDFSSCQPIGTITNIMYGTPHVMAPELIKCMDEKKEYYYDEKIDTWNLGCLLFEILSTESFERDDTDAQIDKIHDPYYKQILILCLEPDPQKRVRVWELGRKMKEDANQNTTIQQQQQQQLLQTSQTSQTTNDDGSTILVEKSQSNQVALDRRQSNQSNRVAICSSEVGQSNNNNNNQSSPFLLSIRGDLNSSNSSNGVGENHWITHHDSLPKKGRMEVGSRSTGQWSEIDKSLFGLSHDRSFALPYKKNQTVKSLRSALVRTRVKKVERS